MATRTTADFHGIDQVCEAFEHNGIPFWAVWNGSNCLCANDEVSDISAATDLLRDFLSRLSPATNNTYHLKIYRDVPEGGITEKTVPSRGAGFRLFELPGGPLEYMQSKWAKKNETLQIASSANNEIMTRLAAIEQKLSEPEEEEEEEEEEKPEGIMGVINGLAQKPEIQAAIIAWVGKILTPPGKIAAVGSVPGDGSLDDSLAILKKADPQLENDLALLAKMATENPGQFNFLLSMLRK
jgi:hypothetical protein